MNYNGLLDKILLTLKDKDGVPSDIFDNMVWTVEAKEKFSLTEYQKNGLLKKLTDEKLIEQAYGGGYKITIEGVIFINNGGYTKKEEVINLRFESIESLEEMQKQSASSMTKLTRWIAVGTLIAALYYVLEVLRNLGWLGCYGK